MVFAYRSARRAAKLLQITWILGSRSGGIEVIACVHWRITAKGIRRSMECVCAGLERHIHHRARLPAVLGRGVLNQVELLNGVDWKNRRRVACDTRPVDDALPGEGFAVEKAVYDVGVVFGAQSIGAGGRKAATGIADHARAQLQQVLIVAAIQRKFVDLLVAERSTQSRGGRVNERFLFGDNDSFCSFACLQGEVDLGVRCDHDLDIGPFAGLEAFGLNSNLVDARREIRSNISASLGGCKGSHGAPLQIRDGHRCTGNSRSGGIGYGSEDPAGIGLAAHGSTEEYANENGHGDRSPHLHG